MTTSIEYRGEKPSFIPTHEENGNIQTLQHNYGGLEISEIIDQSSPSESKDTTIKIHTPVGDEVILNDLLPEGYKFSRSPGVRDTSFDGRSFIKSIFYGEKEPKLFYNDEPQDFWQPGALLKLLHEIGHVRCGVEPTWEEVNVLSRVNSSLTGVDVSSANFALKTTLKPERTAWTYALKTLRAYKERGIDLEPQLDSPEKISAVVHLCLVTYEVALARKFVEDDNSVDEWIKMRKLQAKQAMNSLGSSALIHDALKPSKDLMSQINSETAQ